MLTPDTLLRDAIDATGRSARSFSHVLGVDERTVRRWLAGEREMPGPAVQLCRLLIARPALAEELAGRN